MKVKLKILTPVHIGCNLKISPTEYFIEGNKFIRINIESLIKNPEFKKYQVNFIEQAKNQKPINQILPNKNLLLQNKLYSIEIKIYEKFEPKQVNEFIKSAGRVYIPGSSIKGSILSGILYHFGKNKKLDNYKLKYLFENVLNEISEYKTGKFSRWLDVSDTNMKTPEDALNLSLVKVEGSKSRRISILYETLKPGIEFEFELKTSIDNFYKFGKLTENEILKIVDEFYKKVYEKEKKYKIKEDLPSIPDKGFLIRIGQGVTSFSTSYLLLAEELKIKYHLREPLTRKLISEKIPLGWGVIYE
jgi:CRISPR-associated protein Csm5